MLNLRFLDSPRTPKCVKLPKTVSWKFARLPKFCLVLNFKKQKTGLESIASWEGSGGKSPSNDRKKPCPTYIRLCGQQGWVSHRPTNLLPHTLKNKEMKNNILECKEIVQVLKISHVNKKCKQK